jgi:hypothetical protein
LPRITRDWTFAPRRPRCPCSIYWKDISRSVRKTNPAKREVFLTWAGARISATFSPHFPFSWTSLPTMPRWLASPHTWLCPSRITCLAAGWPRPPLRPNSVHYRNICKYSSLSPKTAIRENPNYLNHKISVFCTWTGDKERALCPNSIHYRNIFKYSCSSHVGLNFLNQRSQYFVPGQGIKSKQGFFCFRGPGQTVPAGHSRERTLTCFPQFPYFGMHIHALQPDQTKTQLKYRRNN